MPGVVPARRVDENVTSFACFRRSSLWARAKNSSSFGLLPGQPPSMYCTPSSSIFCAMRSLSSTVSDETLHLRAIAQRGVEEDEIR